MNNERQLVFIPKISLKTDRITLYNEVLVEDRVNGILKPLPKKRINDPFAIASENNSLEKKFHNFKISFSAQKKIQEKINWLYTLARSRYTKTYNGKEIHNFKINFLTLTLPSTQAHTTAEITSTCFNQFLTEIRHRTKMENYVWRLEFQKNGNVHYHIVTDTFVDYFFAQKVWNRIINKLGYVDQYTKKFSAMSLMEYVENCKNNDVNTFDVLAKRYAKGKSEKWKNPKSIDVKVCTSNKAIAFYISKYFSKKENSTCACNSLDTEENSFALRLWFCSRSLSKLTSITSYQENSEIDYFHLLEGIQNVKEVIYDYCKCLYFDIKNMTPFIKSILYPAFRNYANINSYSSA